MLRFAPINVRVFNALIWIPPSGQRAGDVVLIDSTNFTTLFGGTDSLGNLWQPRDHGVITRGTRDVTIPRRFRRIPDAVAVVFVATLEVD